METLSIEIKDAAPGKIGGEILHFNINEHESDSPVWDEICQAIYRNKLVVLKNQDMSPEEYVSFANKLGTAQVYFQENYHHPDHPEIFVSSNVNQPGEKVGVAGTGHYWHTDCQFQKEPLSFTSITPVVIPTTFRATSYIDMHEVYKKLPQDLKDLVEGATMVHNGNNRYKVQPSDIDKSIAQLIEYQNSIVPEVRHPAVIEHPVTGDKILYISSGFTFKMDGLTWKKFIDTQRIFKHLSRSHCH